jgi:DNA-binding MltR family transcriptional regulator
MADRAYIRNFKMATRGSPSVEELEILEAEMYKENDRTFVIMLVSFLEDALQSFILKLLRNNLTNDERSTLLDYHGPLGTFSSQAAVAYAVGLIGPITRDDLEIIRTIRNGVAHTRRRFSFSLPEAIEICKHLKTPDLEGKWLDVKYMKHSQARDPKWEIAFTTSLPKRDLQRQFIRVASPVGSGDTRSGLGR